MSEKSNNVWKTIIKVIIAVATAIGGVLAVTIAPLIRKALRSK